MFDVKTNYKGSHSDLKCRLGCTEKENLDHVMVCSEITNKGYKTYKEKNVRNVMIKGKLKEMKETQREISYRIQSRDSIYSKLK